MTCSTILRLAPRPSSSGFSASCSPFARSIGGAPSRVFSLTGVGVKVHDVIKRRFLRRLRRTTVDDNTPVFCSKAWPFVPVWRPGSNHAAHPSSRQDAFGCAKTVIRHRPNAQLPPVQPRSHDTHNLKIVSSKPTPASSLHRSLELRTCLSMAHGCIAICSMCCHSSRCTTTVSYDVERRSW